MPQLHVLITGASRGIGAALAENYAKSGAVLSLLARNPASLETLSAELRATGTAIRCYPVDVTDYNLLQQQITKIDSELPVDIALINAGISSNTAAGWEAWADMQRVIQTNTLGAMAAAQPLIRTMEQRSCGKLVFISSISAYRGMALTPSYCASKAAIFSYAESLRGWLAPRGVTVIAALPGFVDSDMSRAFPGERPMLNSARQAASKIVSGVERNHAVIAFPFRMALGIRLLSWLPAGFGDKILQRLGYGRKP